MEDQAPSIDPEQLCIGLYVELGLGWMEHPFAFNRFKIKTQDQIDTLKRLGLERIHYNPAKSDCLPLQPPDQDAPPPPPPPPPSAAEVAASAEKQARIERVAKLRRGIERVEKQFLQSADLLKKINRQLRSRPEETLEQTDAMVSSLVAAAQAQGDMQLHAISQSLGEDVYFHSLNVTVLSLLLGQAIHLKTEELQQLGLGAILHDVGLLEVPDAISARRENLSRPEQAIYQTHVRSGIKLGKRLQLGEQALSIIAQHHERSDGSGYPEGLSGAAISLPARIVALINAYDNLCNPQDLTKALTPYEALSFLFAKQRDKFDQTLLRTLIHTLGVFPPGTVVRLSDQRIGLVLSVNTREALKPAVLVYDPDIPAEAALMLDLQAEPELKIVEGIKPALLPNEIFQYLNPRQRVTYAFDKQPGSRRR